MAGRREDLVHDLGACRDHWPELAAIDDLGCPSRRVSDEPGDLLEADPVMAHEAHERGAQLLLACSNQIRCDASDLWSPGTTVYAQIRPLRVSVAERRGSVPWPSRQPTHEVRVWSSDRLRRSAKAVRRTPPI